MRIQGFDFKKNETDEWILNTKRSIRIASFVIGCLFFIICLYLAINEKNLTFLIYLTIGILLTGGSLFSEEIRISKNGVEYKNAFPFRRHKKFPFGDLISVHHGAVDLFIGRTKLAGYRVWFEFSNELPISVIYEKTIKWTPTASVDGEKIAAEAASSLGIPLVKSKF